MFFGCFISQGDENASAEKKGGGTSGSKRSHNTASTRKINTYFFKKPRVEDDAGALNTGSEIEIEIPPAEVNDDLDIAPSSDQTTAIAAASSSSDRTSDMPL